MSYQRVTMIDDLPDLSDLETQGPRPLQTATKHGSITQSQYPGMGPPQPGPGIDVEKYIRGNGRTAHPESGMVSRPPPMVQESFTPPSHQIIEHLENEPKVTKMPSDSPDCITVHDHIKNCPLCSKFYNNDKTIYIIAIAVLAIICILLLKRVLDV